MILTVDVDTIIAELSLKYNISHSTLMKLKTFLGKVGNYKYLYYMTETFKSKPPKRESTDGEIFLPPKEYIRVKYNAIIFGIVEHGQIHKLHYHRLILTNQQIDYKDIQKRFGKYYYIHFEILNSDGETIRKVIKYMFKQKKKKDTN